MNVINFMSRITKQNNEYTIAYGQDHIFGNFIQVFDASYPDDDPIEDQDHLAIQEVIMIAGRYGIKLTENDIMEM